MVADRTYYAFGGPIPTVRTSSFLGSIEVLILICSEIKCKTLDFDHSHHLSHLIFGKISEHRLSINSVIERVGIHFFDHEHIFDIDGEAIDLNGSRIVFFVPLGFIGLEGVVAL